MAEFELIKHYFRRPHNRHDVVLGSGDDAALLSPPVDQCLVSSIDAMVAGVHFPEETSAADIGYKSVAVSLSDMAAMGAEPAWVVATLSLPEVDRPWLKAFSEGFYALIDAHNLALVGGDLVQGPLAISTQLTGFVPKDLALLRSGAQPGDKIYVTGALGGAGLALQLIKNGQPVSDKLRRYLDRPTPRIQEGLALRGIASSAVDVTDGLLADLNHLLESSSLGADLDALPLADPQVTLELAMNAGDDFELCFTVPPEKTSELNIECTCIGEITKEPGIRMRVDGKLASVTARGYEHF